MSIQSHVCLALLASASMLACESSDVEREPNPTADASVGQGGADGGSSDAAIDSGDPIPPADWCQNADTVLGQTVASLAAGGFAELPANASLAALDLHSHLTAWADTGVWDPTRRRVQWVGSPGSCCADPAAYQLLDYDVVADAWQVLATPWGDDPGHAYDGNALDPSTGLHYFARGGDDIRGWDGSSWGAALPAAPFHGTIAVGITWFRDANAGDGGLVHVGPTDNVGVFDGQTWTVPDLQITGWGGYHMFAEYNPVHHVVWLGAGNDGDNRHARLTESLDVQQLQDAPVSLNATGAARKTYDPRSGSFIVLSEVDDVESWWEYDIVSDSWSDITTTMQAALPASWTTSGHRFVVPIDDCGVIIYFQHVDTERTVYVYRHSE